jgi:HD-GYP domain-containing protein (c-di-GMP phosphodiesterase class II)
MTDVALRNLDDSLPAPPSIPESARGRLRRALGALMEELERRERDATGHAREVAELAVEIASRLGLSADEIRQIRLGALLHDVGKLAVPDDILAKPGPLTEDEWALMREHPSAGERFLEPLLERSGAVTAAGVRTVLAIVRWHHERWDGAGYPDRLAGDEIPLGARIVAVADALRAMTERRPYRSALSPEAALAEVSREAGRQFDPSVASVVIAA